MPTSVDANVNLSLALHQLVPAWHMPMMNDTHRNEAYVEALAAAVTKETNVLEIGTGSGLLAMISARLGARQVVTCEAVPLIAAIARDIVAANGWDSAVSVISKMSKDLVIGVDLPQRANLLVSEILSSELLGEGVLASIEDAKRRLLAPDAKIIPAMGSVVCALAGGEAIKKNMMVDEVLGFNLSGFNAIASQKRYIHRHDLDIDLLTDTTEAFVFDFVRRDHFPAEHKTLRIPITAAGCCYGIAQWIRLRLDDNVTFENHPSAKTSASSWQTCFYRFPTPIDVHPGQTAIVSAAHNRSAVWFFWKGLEG
jgi:predicted RNA methylase